MPASASAAAIASADVFGRYLARMRGVCHYSVADGRAFLENIPGPSSDAPPPKMTTCESQSLADLPPRRVLTPDASDKERHQARVERTKLAMERGVDPGEIARAAQEKQDPETCIPPTVCVMDMDDGTGQAVHHSPFAEYTVEWLVSTGHIVYYTSPNTVQIIATKAAPKHPCRRILGKERHKEGDPNYKYPYGRLYDDFVEFEMNGGEPEKTPTAFGRYHTITKPEHRPEWTPYTQWHVPLQCAIGYLNCYAITTTELRAEQNYEEYFCYDYDEHRRPPNPNEGYEACYTDIGARFTSAYFQRAYEFFITSTLLRNQNNRPDDPLCRDCVTLSLRADQYKGYRATEYDALRKALVGVEMSDPTAHIEAMGRSGVASMNDVRTVLRAWRKTEHLTHDPEYENPPRPSQNRSEWRKERRNLVHPYDVRALEVGEFRALNEFGQRNTWQINVFRDTPIDVEGAFRRVEGGRCARRAC